MFNPRQYYDFLLRRNTDAILASHPVMLFVRDALGMRTRGRRQRGQEEDLPRPAQLFVSLLQLLQRVLVDLRGFLLLQGGVVSPVGARGQVALVVSEDGGSGPVPLYEIREAAVLQDAADLLAASSLGREGRQEMLDLVLDEPSQRERVPALRWEGRGATTPGRGAIWRMLGVVFRFPRAAILSPRPIGAGFIVGAVAVIIIIDDVVIAFY